jgi:SAM-dependent methyltransferase
LLGTEWLPGIVDVDARLRAEPPARVLDVACGTGWASIAMAQAHPNITVDGVDLDHDTISAARRNAERAGAADRVRFSVADAADLAGVGGYNLVVIFEALHDMSRPVDVLSAARQVSHRTGLCWWRMGWLPRSSRSPAHPWNDLRTAGVSSPACPVPWETRRPAATGAVMRPSVLRQHALQAGFGGMEVLPIRTDYWRFYRLLR